MMKTTTTRKRPAQERGTADHGWLQARFSFSFAEYFDPDHMGFRSLRVMNNDTIAPASGFPSHPHRDAEIFSYILEGQLEHKDSMGNGAVIEAGNLQYMSAGSGVVHSEFNPSSTQPTTMYQIWIMPKENGGEPRYAEKPLGEEASPNQLHLLFSSDGRDDSTAIRAEAEIYYAHIEAGQRVSLPASMTTPHVWVQAMTGSVEVLEHVLNRGDGLAAEDAPQPVELTAKEDSQVLVFRLA